MLLSIDQTRRFVRLSPPSRRLCLDQRLGILLLATGAASKHVDHTITINYANPTLCGIVLCTGDSGHFCLSSGNKTPEVFAKYTSSRGALLALTHLQYV